MSASSFRHWPTDKLADKIKQYDAAVDAIMGGAQSYSMNGVSITRANLQQIQDSLGDMYTEQARRAGQMKTSAYPVVRRESDCY